MKPQTVIGKAIELIEIHGEVYAILFSQNKIEELGEIKNFEQVCKLSGFQTAIEYIKKLNK